MLLIPVWNKYAHPLIIALNDLRNCLILNTHFLFCAVFNPCMFFYTQHALDDMMIAMNDTLVFISAIESHTNNQSDV